VAQATARSAARAERRSTAPGSIRLTGPRVGGGVSTYGFGHQGTKADVRRA